MEIKKIVVPTDFDDLSKKAIMFALDLAEQLKVSEIVSMNILTPAHTHTTAGDMLATESLMAGQLNKVILEKHQDLAQKEAKSLSTERVKITPVVTFGNSISDLNAIMKKFDAGLLVCGSRDENSLMERLFGSDTEKIVRKVDYPAIILKKETEISDISIIAVAIDVNEEAQEGLKEIQEFGASFNARLQLLHVITHDKISPEEAIEKLRKLAQKNKFENYDINIVNNDSLESGLRSFVRKNNPDMIAVLSQGKSRIKKLIFGSSIEDIIEETDKPVFVSKIS
jgi:nucleotide-binding universal stress UspA family protein